MTERVEEEVSVKFPLLEIYTLTSFHTEFFPHSILLLPSPNAFDKEKFLKIVISITFLSPISIDPFLKIKEFFLIRFPCRKPPECKKSTDLENFLSKVVLGCSESLAHFFKR